MTRRPIHRPPPDPVIAALVRAGLSESTASAMERWKATEVLELLRLSTDVMAEPLAASRGTL